MMLVVTGVGSLIHVYSVGYMEDDPGYARYFAYLNLFVFFMLMLVLGVELPGDVRRLGGRRAVQLPAHRLLVPATARRRTPARRRSSSTASATSASWSRCSCCSPTSGTLDFTTVFEAAPAAFTYGGAVDHGHHALPLPGRDGQERADPALRLAARRHGGPDAGVGADPRRHHGHGGRLHGGALDVLFALAPVVEHRRGRGHRRADGAVRRDHRARPVRHQEGAGLLHRLAARLHVPRRGRRAPTRRASSTS